MGPDTIRRGFRPATLVTNAAMLACLTGTLPAHVVAGDATPVPSQVVTSGMVSDEATKAAMLAKLRELYGSANVVNQIEVGSVMSPPDWSANMQKILSPAIKQVNRGQLNADDTQVSLHNDVDNEVQHQQLTSDMATALGQGYTVENGLRMAAVSGQRLLDQTLANRIIEFETGSATLTPEGHAILDGVAAMLPRLNGHKIGVVGHTDSSGGRALSLNLNQARTEAAKSYLIAKGAEQGTLTTTGAGPDRPVAANNVDEGRSRNRRIEFQANK